jgi:hypothetical protein
MRNGSEHKASFYQFPNQLCAVTGTIGNFIFIYRLAILSVAGGGACITYTIVQKTTFTLPAPAHFIQVEQFHPRGIRRQSRTKSALNFSAFIGRLITKSKCDFIHPVILSDGPNLFRVIFTQSAVIFCL